TAMVASIPGMLYGLMSLTRIQIWKRFAILVLLLLAIVTVIPVVQPLTSFQRLGTTGDAIAEGDLNQRTLLWSEGFDVFIKNPILGVGSDMYRSVNSLGKVAHNTFLSVLVELGLIGLTLFGMILMIAVYQALKQPKEDAIFWLSVLTVWVIGASMLTWEYRKTTWLFLTFIVASGALTRYQEPKAIKLAQPSSIHILSSCVLSDEYVSTTATTSDKPATEKYYTIDDY
ncbi:MAG TPA: hypothetical protein DCX54_12740, partial [Flavobacteriales bacterium]|nr:hypothetical protein [Flavobacteriales bacterium]